MSLLDALLLDPFPLDVWVAPRTDGVLGSGTEDDPFDGSTLSASPLSIQQITHTGTTATVSTFVNHGFQNGQLVIVYGVTGADASTYNGTFYIFGVSPSTPTQFQYTMAKTPSSNWTNPGAFCLLDTNRFDSVMRTIPTDLAGISNSGATATVTAYYHGFQNNDFVIVAGATGPYASYFNGTFQISAVTTNTFNYTMNGSPGGAPNAIGMSCRVVRQTTVPPGINPPVRVRLGPGLIQTKGSAVPELTSWVPRSGMKIAGSGIGITTLQLAGGSNDGGTYSAITGDVYTDTLETSDFTVDCNVSGQLTQNVVCGAIDVVGKHTRIRRLRVIGFGAQAPAECFPIGAANGFAGSPESYDCVVTDCILEQPGLNSTEMGTLIAMIAAEGSYMPYHRACVIRNCFADGEYRQNPVVPITSILFNSVTGKATVNTSLPQGHLNGDYVRISGAVVSGSTNNSFNGTYPISDATATSFTYKPNPAPNVSTPTGELWVGRFPSQYVLITSIIFPPAGTGPFTYTLQTASPHFLAPGQMVLIAGAPAPFGGSGVFQVFSVNDSSGNPSSVCFLPPVK